MTIGRLALALALGAALTAPAGGHDAPHGPPPTRQAIDPATAYPSRLIAAGGGHFHVLLAAPDASWLLAGTHRGLFRSRDRGLTWRLVASRFSGDDVHGLARDPRSGAVHAATHGQGLLVSRDAGRRWHDDSAGLPGRDLHALALDPRRPEVVYVWAVGHGLLRREGSQGRWERRAEAAALEDVQGLAVHPEEPRRLYAATARGVWLSTDGGRRWSRPPGGLSGRAAAVGVVPHEPDTLLAATEEGVYTGDADAARWRPLPAAPAWWGLLVGFAFPARLSGAVLALSHEGVVSVRRAGGAWTPLAAPDFKEMRRAP